MTALTRLGPGGYPVGSASSGVSGAANGQASVSGAADALETAAGAANGQASAFGGVIISASGTANGQASVTGSNSYGTANGQAAVSGATGINIAVVGAANGQASALGFSNPASAAGTAGGQASAVGWVLILAPSSGEADGQASAFGSVPHFAVLAQNLTLHPSHVPTKINVLALAQNLTGHQADVEQWRWGRTIAQNLSLHLAQAQQTTYHVVDADVIKLAAVFTRAFPVTLSQALTVHQATALAAAVILLQRLKITPTHIPKLTYHLALAQAILTTPALAHFLGLSLTQAMTVHDELTRTYLASPLLTQNLTVHAAFVNTLMIQVVSTIDIHPAHIPHMIYAGDALLDGVVMTGLYISPNGTVTTWAINTRTNAVTEYDNYGFNSFAPMGRRYLAANSSGIYELDGDTDAGTAIIAEAQSGLARLNGTKMSGLKGAYLAVRGGGRFYVKLISGDGREYIYEAIAQPGLMTTKINVGKGLRTSYIAFNLQNEGQDFDLDEIEFVPMLSDRRV